ncbi:MAG TPA: hypothetical protein VG294_18820 [Solirubrobacteraceae bacterium]|nr:hypothetical protein [Solirubrobacteraceae bacterium]
MKIHPITTRPRRLPVLVARTGVVALLTPVILVAGVIAVTVMTAVILTRPVFARVVAPRQLERAPVLQLETSPAKSGVGL